MCAPHGPADLLDKVFAQVNAVVALRVGAQPDALVGSITRRQVYANVVVQHILGASNKAWPIAEQDGCCSLECPFGGWAAKQAGRQADRQSVRPCACAAWVGEWAWGHATRATMHD